MAGVVKLLHKTTGTLLLSSNLDMEFWPWLYGVGHFPQAGDETAAITTTDGLPLLTTDGIEITTEEG